MRAFRLNFGQIFELAQTVLLNTNNQEPYQKNRGRLYGAAAGSTSKRSYPAIMTPQEGRQGALPRILLQIADVGQDLIVGGGWPRRARCDETMDLEEADRSQLAGSIKGHRADHRLPAG
jgi:hypothetical protein